MAYGEIKVDTITFTDGGIDKSVTISGLVQNPTFSGNITVTGTISGNIVRGQTISGVTVTGTTAQFTSGTFTSITGDTATITSGVFASGTAAAPSVSVGTTTNGFYSPATNQIAISTSGTGRLFVDSSGRLLVGTSTARGVSSATNSLYQIETTSTSLGASVVRNSNDATGAILALGKSRGAAVNSITIVTAGDILGEIRFAGADGTDLETQAATISAQVDGTPGANDMPGRLVFSTTADGASSPTERLRIDSSGRLLVGTSSTSASTTALLQGNSVSSTDGAVLRLAAGAATPADNTDLGYVMFSDSSHSQSAIFRAQRDGGTWSISSKPTRFVFSTTADGASSPTERMRIDSSGRVGIGTTPAYALDVATPSNLSFRTKNTDIGSALQAQFHNDSDLGVNIISYGSSYAAGSLLNVGSSGSAINASRALGINVGSTYSLRFGVGNNEVARIDSSGRLLLGTSAARANYFNEPYATKLQIEDTGASASMSITANTSISSQRPILVFGRANGASVGSTTVVATSSKLGSISFQGSDGTEFVEAASIEAVVDGTPGANDMPGRLVFSTTADGASSPTERLRIDSSGRVGIGTASPSSRLSIVSASNSIALDITDASSSDFAITPGVSSGVCRVGPATGAMALYTGNTERARIDSSGRLLVGTSSARSSFFGSAASSELQLEGEGEFSAVRNINDAFGGSIILGKTRSSGNTIVSNGDALGNITYQGNDGSLFVEAARIAAFVDGTPGANDMPGRLVFSTTADGASSPTERMRIDSEGKTSIYSTGDPVLAARSSRVAGTVDTIYTGYYSATSTTTGTVSFRVCTNGNVQNTNNSYGAISDIKLKENIVDANSQWDDIRALQVRNYNFKEGQTHTQIGLVAQEVELVSPGLVTESPDRDEDGKDLGTVTKSVNYSVLYMKAVKALQEAMERIETLEAKVAALESA